MRFLENVKDWLWQVFTDHPYEWTDSEGEIYVRVMPRSRKTQSNIPKVVAAVLLVPIILGATACGPGEPEVAPVFVEVTSTPSPIPPDTATPYPTYTQFPTYTPYPTLTPVPTATKPPAPTAPRTPRPTNTRSPTPTPRPTAHANIRQALDCGDCAFVLPRTGTSNKDLKRFIDWPAPSKHGDPFIVAACGTGKSLDGTNRTHVVAHSNLGSGARATVSNVILINSTKGFPDKQCFAALAKYDGFTYVEWMRRTRNISGVPLPYPEYYDVDHVTFRQPTKRMEISTAEFLTLLRAETP